MGTKREKQTVGRKRKERERRENGSEREGNREKKGGEEKKRIKSYAREGTRNKGEKNEIRRK